MAGRPEQGSKVLWLEFNIEGTRLTWEIQCRLDGRDFVVRTGSPGQGTFQNVGKGNRTTAP